MNIIKFFGMCLVFAGCAGLGLYYRMQEIVRYRNLQEIQKAMAVIRGEISAVHTPLPDALYQAARRTRGVISAFFSAVVKELEGGGGELRLIWRAKLQETVSAMQLCERDRRELERMGEMLGYLDVEMQLQSIDLFSGMVEQGMRDMEGESEKRSRLYPVLGMAAGILLCILLL